MKRIFKIIGYCLMVIVAVLIFFIYILVVLDKSFKEDSMPLRAPYPIYKTKGFMPDVIKEMYIGMPLNEFEKIDMPIEINRNSDPLFYFSYRDYPTATLKLQGEGKSSFTYFSFKFIDSKQGRVSLASIEACSNTAEFSLEERNQTLSDYLESYTEKVGAGPRKGLWLKELYKDSKKRSKDQPSKTIAFVWETRYAVVVLAMPCRSKDCDVTNFTWSIYDLSTFYSCNGDFVEMSAKGSHNGDKRWERKERKIEKAYEEATFDSLPDIECLEWFVPKDKCVK